ncbi:6002_t:CDS:2 [Funneliformis mosseae]|uniref:6002_t:CDS:1 n=1 Tax=Funneliformis mosseae TaxID=27381 RepID=A0A9N9DYE8_FUNMO|nr:6002_t:CDS:2 [Funneliformis mosseae]
MPKLQVLVFQKLKIIPQLISDFLANGNPPFKDEVNNNQDLIVAITCHETRETTIAETPEDYEKLYKRCWKQEPKQRPIIKKVLKCF